MLRICCLISSFATICFEPWSIPYASDIRRGRRRSHPRHWKVLAELVSIASRDLEVKCDNEFPWLQIGNNLEPFKISQNSAFKRGQRGPSKSESEFGVGVWPFCRHFLPPRQTGRAARSACQCGVEWVDFGAGSGSASQSRVHMFRHSPDFQFKKRTTFAAFTASKRVAESSYAFSGTAGSGALDHFHTMVTRTTR